MNLSSLIPFSWSKCQKQLYPQICIHCWPCWLSLGLFSELCSIALKNCLWKDLHLMNFSAAFSELFILSHLVWNFLLQLSKLSEFHLPTLWCLAPLVTLNVQILPKLFPRFPLLTLQQGIWGPVDVRAWVRICHEKCAVSDLSRLSSAHCPQLSLISFARNYKSWKVKSAGDVPPLHCTQNEFLAASKRSVYLILLYKESVLFI